MNEQNSVYERIEALCRSHGINITEMCKLCSIPRAIMTDFKMGRNKSLSAENLRKISEHFSCSVEYLLSGEPLLVENEEDCDIYWCEKGYITVTPILFNKTDYKKLGEVKEKCEQLL